MKLYCLLLAALVWPTNPLWAQVDIESLRRDDQAGFFGSVAIDLTLRAGNVELFECGPELSLSYGRAEDTFIFIGSGDAGWEGKERFSMKRWRTCAMSEPWARGCTEKPSDKLITTNPSAWSFAALPAAASVGLSSPRASHLFG